MVRAWKDDWLRLEGSLHHKLARHRRLLVLKAKKRSYTAFFQALRHVAPMLRLQVPLWVSQHIERPLSTRHGTQEGIDFTNFDDHDLAAVSRLQDVDQLVATAKAFELGFETLVLPWSMIILDGPEKQ